MYAPNDKMFSATAWKAITPSNTALLEPCPVALWVGGAGDIAIVGHDGVSATLSAAPAGAVVTVQPRQLLSTGTTATLIVGLYT